MKKKILLLGLLLISFSVMAYVTLSFPGWDALRDKSSDILIVHCTNVQDPYNTIKNGYIIDFRGLVEADYEIVSVLKGTTNSGVVRISSEYWPKQGYFYLLFKNYGDGQYSGLEAYRVVHLGSPFSTNSIANKSLDEQLQVLFKRAHGQLNEEIHEAQDQKNLIDEAIQK
jgi:hypothetical protein